MNWVSWAIIWLAIMAAYFMGMARGFRAGRHEERRLVGRDAERYRWLRHHFTDDTPEQYDALVDEGMKSAAHDLSLIHI